MIEKPTATEAQEAAMRELAHAVTIPVVASGGFASIDDVKRLIESRYRMLEGAIVGRALYDGRLDAREALQLIAASGLAKHP